MLFENLFRVSDFGYCVRYSAVRLKKWWAARENLHLASSLIGKWVILSGWYCSGLEAATFAAASSSCPDWAHVSLPSFPLSARHPRIQNFGIFYERGRKNWIIKSEAVIELCPTILWGIGFQINELFWQNIAHPIQNKTHFSARNPYF